jgi:F-type H+-transporting ATPase subunit epsilon
MRLEIITPEKEIFKGEAEAVQLPGLDGSFQLLNGHAPIISGLSNGTIKVNLVSPFELAEKTSNSVVRDSTNAKVIRVVIKGGVMEMCQNKVIILAE